MELVLTTQDLDPLPRHEEGTFNLENNGLLNSNFKQVSRNNFNNFNSNSVFGRRQLVKRNKFIHTTSVETIIKVSLFVIITIITLS